MYIVQLHTNIGIITSVVKYGSQNRVLQVGNWSCCSITELLFIIIINIYMYVYIFKMYLH